MTVHDTPADYRHPLESCSQYLLDILDVPPGALPDRVQGHWEKMYHLAREERVFHYLAAWSLEYWDGSMPETLKTHLRFELEWNRVRNIRLSFEIIELARLFDAAGVPALFLKGAAGLVRGLYPAGWRFLSDIDVLVKEADSPALMESLRSAGYCGKPGEGWFHHHLPPLYRQGKAGALEIHLRPYKYVFREGVLNDIWKDSQPVDFGGRAVRVPSLTDHLWILLRTDLIENIFAKRLNSLAEISLLFHSGGAIDYDLLAWRAHREGIPNFLTMIAISLERNFRISSWNRVENGQIQRWERDGLQHQRALYHGKVRNHLVSACHAALKYLPHPGFWNRYALLKNLLGNRTVWASLLLSLSPGTGAVSRIQRILGK